MKGEVCHKNDATTAIRYRDDKEDAAVMRQPHSRAGRRKDASRPKDDILSVPQLIKEAKIEFNTAGLQPQKTWYAGNVV